MNTETLGPLYGLDSKGQTKQWMATITEWAPDNIELKFEFGRMGMKQQCQTKYVKVGKNIGRANETTPWEQGCADATSKYNKKVDAGYSLDPNGLTQPILPMLAQTFKPGKTKLQLPAFIQKKIDGVRCTACVEDGKVIIRSRKGKEMTPMPHIEQEIRHLLEGNDGYLDGELYSDTLTFQELAGTLRRSSNDIETLDQIYYIIFDSFVANNNTEPFTDRMEELQKQFSGSDYRYLTLIETNVLTDVGDIPKICEEYMNEGFEGIIIRNSFGPYKLGHRSKDLLKFKQFMDDEYVIVGFKEGDGTEIGCVVWECETADGQKFWARPRGTQEQRRELFNTGNDYLGKELTVRFQELTDDGIPRFPVGIIIRDDKVYL